MRSSKRTLIQATSLLLIIGLVAGCSGKKLKSGIGEEDEQWFCQMNAAGDGWECVQDNELARSPKPTRYPHLVDEPDPDENDYPSFEPAAGVSGVID